jgi:soluble cytochrome b562
MIKPLAATLLCCLLLLSVARADTPLDRSMKRIADAYHQLTSDLKAPDDTKKADYLALADTMKTEAIKSKDLIPKKVSTIPADQQAAMTAAYQKAMGDLAASIDTLSQDLQAGNWDNARKDMDKLHMEENEGHKEFRMGKETKAPYTTIPPGTPPPPGAPVPPPAPANPPAAPSTPPPAQ